MQNIVLIGFMGSGKTTVGKSLAEKLQMNFVDTDVLIEQEKGKSINAIFEEEGERKFRELERNLLENLRLSNTVLATGGGMPCFNNNIEVLRQIGKVIYLQTSEGQIVERLRNEINKRPLLIKGEYEITKLIKLRTQFYLKADFVINNDGKLEFVVNEIIDKVVNRNKYNVGLE